MIKKIQSFIVRLLIKRALRKREREKLPQVEAFMAWYEGTKSSSV